MILILKGYCTSLAVESMYPLYEQMVIKLHGVEDVRLSISIAVPFPRGLPNLNARSTVTVAGWFFFSSLLRLFCRRSASPPPYSISDVKHVAGCSVCSERYSQHYGSCLVERHSFKFFCKNGFTNLYVLTPPRI
jgi:hypothetical protein